MLAVIGYFILILVGIPIGYLLAYLCGDELIKARRLLIILCGFAIIIGGISFYKQQYALAATLAVLVELSFISFYKSYDKKLTGKVIK